MYNNGNCRPVNRTKIIRRLAAKWLHFSIMQYDGGVNLGVHDGHRQRLRERFLKEGLSGFAPVNVLELLLFFTNQRCDTSETAHRLLERFGSFSGVLDAPYATLCAAEGVGPLSACLIKLTAACGAFYANDRAARLGSILSTKQAGAYFVPKFTGSTSEEVYLLLLDDKRKILRCAKLFEGTVNAAAITLKKVMAEVVISNATAVILAHNHPGGLALPSAEDKAVTKQISTALDMINVRLLDHVIVADEEFFSMASGLLHAMPAVPQ